MRTNVYTLMAMGISIGLAAAKTRHVPTQYVTLQKAVDESVAPKSSQVVGPESPMRFTLSPATEFDKASIREVNNRCYRAEVEAQFGSWDDYQQLGFFEKKWDPTRFQKIIYRGRMAGVLVVDTHLNYVFLSEIQIDPEFQGQGLGTDVMSDLLRQADEDGVPVRLQVLIKNRAKSMYDRLGFIVTDETKTHYLMERPNKDAR